MDANTRNELIAWLKQDADDPQECRVLCNVRCLSEGVDVPALDAVLFLSPRNSEVEVVQSVGRVMRTFGKGTDKEKKYGYIIIPVIVPNDVKPEDALNDNERFKVVWTILNALRSHDENFNAHVNQINLNKTRPPKITVARVPRDTYGLGTMAAEDGPQHLENEEVARQLELRFGTLQDGIYARLVEKVGDKMYWENWAKSVGEIAQKFIERIALLIKENDNARNYFKEFISGLHKNINDSIDEGQAIEMLAQHMITRPVFDALFKEYEFVNNNAVSRSMQDMLEVLESEGMEMDTAVLDKFYTSVKNNISNIDNLEAKQTIIKNLYEKFFKGAFPLTVEKLGIVYTPVECVDFIIHSVEDILQQEFNTSLTEENVHILDPFVGTGTFITRLLQSGLIKKEDMLRKYKNEIHCNEIVLLAYYIADVNIEAVYHDIMHPEKYEMYDGICLTDTFQLNEHGDNDIFSQLFPENSERLQKQKKAPVRVIIGNPPYSVGQKNANDNAQNLKYPQLDKRIEDTYAKSSKSGNKRALYDSYIKAIRWATDRICKSEDGGIIAFMTPNTWIDGNSQDGMRIMLEKEFSSIYLLDLKGNGRTSGERCRQEGEPLFAAHGGQGGSLLGASITILVKNPNKNKCSINYYGIGDYLKRVEKLKRVKESNSIANLNWQSITPNDKFDWLNQRDGLFDNLVPIVPDKKFQIKAKSFFSIDSCGLTTCRDPYTFNFSKKNLRGIVNRMITFYSQQQDNLNPQVNTQEISWSRGLKKLLAKGVELKYEEISIVNSLYRPFCISHVYFNRDFNEYVYSLPQFFPLDEKYDNIVICVSSVGNKGLSILASKYLPDYHFAGDSHIFPLYWYEENKNRQTSWLDENATNEYLRRDGITDWILKEVRTRYGAKNITKEMIFYYVYGLLHSKDYRERFAADLKKSLPRIPIVDSLDDFMEFYKAGKELADLHLNYETVDPYPDVIVHGDRQVPLTVKRDPATGGYIQAPTDDGAYDYFRVIDKMRFKSKDDKSTIIYNGNITIENIPQKAYEYIVNGKSAIEWIVERYAVTQDKKSLIKNDANDWAREHHKPRYILDLLLSVINVSVQTVDIVNNLPKLKFE
jgi:predicted helicase